MPFQIAGGAAPDVAIDRGGTAHVVWEVDSTPQQTHYCRILSGRRGCARGTERAFTPPTSQFPSRQDDGPHVLLAPGRVIVVTTRCCNSSPPAKSVFRYSSSDGGATFDGGAAIGTVGSRWAALTGGGVAMLSTYWSGVNEDPLFQLAPLDGPQATAEPDLAPGAYTLVGELSLAAAADGRPVAAWSDGQTLFSGVPGAGADPNDPSIWRVQSLGRAMEPHLAAGGGALWLLSRPSKVGGVGGTLRRFSARRGTFGRARRAARRGVNSTLAVNPGGDAFFVFEYSNGVFFSRTTRRGRRLAGRFRRILGPSGLGYNNPRLAVGRRGRGLLVYTTGLDGGRVGGVWLPRV